MSLVLIVKLPGDSNYTTYQTSQNISSFENFGLSANYSRQINKWLGRSIFSRILFNNHYRGVIEGQNIDLSHFSFIANGSSQFSFWEGMKTRRIQRLL